MKKLIWLTGATVAFVMMVSSTSLAGDVTLDDSNTNRGTPGCPTGYCPNGHGGCVKTNGGCCKPGGLASPAPAGTADQPTCPSTQVGNPIDMRNGNKFHEEVLYVGGGEMPLKFSLYYNSKHYKMVGGIRKVAGQWTYSYSSHLILPAGLGLGDRTVEVRREDGQSIFFVEPAVPVAGHFANQDPGDYGFFRTTGFVSGAYTGFEYELPNGDIETYDAAGLLTEISTREGVITDISRSTDIPTSITTVTISRSGGAGGEMSFDYVDGVGTSESYCFRCPTTFLSPDTHAYIIGQNVTGLIDSVDYPNESPPGGPGGTATKTFLYDWTPPPVPGGCPSDWECDTALTGIVDEENKRWATWDYLPYLGMLDPMTPVGPTHMAWAYISYHGTAAEMEDHVEFSQGTFQQFGTPDPAYLDKYIVQHNFGVRDVYDIDHREFGNDVVEILPRLGSIRDLRNWDNAEDNPDNIEVRDVSYTYFDDGDPLAPSLKNGLVKEQMVQTNIFTHDTNLERNGIQYDYYEDGNMDGVADQLLKSKTELVGPLGTETILRVTDYEWDFNLRKPTKITVSGGSPLAVEYTEDRTYTAEGRILTTTITDKTSHTVPITTLDRARVTTYGYTYHDPGANSRPKIVTIDGPRPNSPTPDVTTYEYSVEGFLKRVEDANGLETEWAGHNFRGQPGSRTDPDQTVTNFEYHPRGWLRKRERLGEVWEYKYFLNGLLKEVSFPDGSGLAYTYTDARKLQTIENTFGDKVTFIRTFEVDANGRTGDLKVDTTLSDDADTVVATSSVRIDSRGRIFEASGPDNQTTEYSYELENRLKTITQKGHAVHGDLTTTFAYDGLDRIGSITYPLPIGGGTADVVSFAYSLRNQVKEVTDARGLKTEYRLDGFGDLIRLVSPDSGTTDYFYDEAGNLLTDSQDLGGSVTTSRTRVYDTVGRLTSETSSPDGVEHTWEYDLGDNSPFVNREGRLARVTDNTGSTEYGYDDFGRVARVRKTINSSALTPPVVDVIYDYDAVGNLLSIVYPSGRTVRFQRAEGRVTSAKWDSVSPVVTTDLATTIGYFPFRGIDDLTYGNSLVMNRERDTSQRLDTYEISHEDMGVVTTRIDRSYSYDGFDQVTGITDALNSAATQALTYDERHRLDTASGIYGAYAYGYDGADNRILRAFTRPGEALQVVETHSPSLTSNRLDSVDINDPVAGLQFLRELQHDARGNVTEDRRSATKHLQFTYNDRNRMKTVLQRTVPEPGIVFLLGSGSAFLASLARRRKSSHRPPAARCGYSSTARMFLLLVPIALAVGTGFPAAAQAQDTDGDGIPDSFEIASQSHPTNWPLDETQSFDGYMDYDGDGVPNREEYLNTTDIWDRLDCGTACHPIIDDFTVDKTWILETGNVLVTWTTIHGDNIRVEPASLGIVQDQETGSQSVTISESTLFTLIVTNTNRSRVLSRQVDVFEEVHANDYNAGHQRVRTLTDTDERLFVYGPGGQLLSELDKDGIPLVEYVYLEGEPLAQIHDAPGSGTEETYYVHNSHLGTPEMMTDDSRQVVWEIQTTPFGEVYSEGPPLGVTQRTRFPGQYADGGIELSYNWHRYYDPSLGRYISADPIGQAGGVNVYAYAANNPANAIDPDGLRGGRPPPMRPNEFRSNTPGSGPIPNVSVPIAVAGAFLTSLGLIPAPPQLPEEPGLDFSPQPDIPFVDPFAPQGLIDGLPNPMCDPSIQCCL